MQQNLLFASNLNKWVIFYVLARNKKFIGNSDVFRPCVQNKCWLIRSLRVVFASPELVPIFLIFSDLVGRHNCSSNVNS